MCVNDILLLPLIIEHGRHCALFGNAIAEWTLKKQGKDAGARAERLCFGCWVEPLGPPEL